jgi:hypothetical protein
VWLHEAPQNGRATIPAGFDPTQLFKAYRELRYNAQIRYAEHKTKDETYSYNLVKFLKLPMRVQ